MAIDPPLDPLEPRFEPALPSDPSLRSMAAVGSAALRSLRFRFCAKRRSRLASTYTILIRASYAASRSTTCVLISRLRFVALQPKSSPERRKARAFSRAVCPTVPWLPVAWPLVSSRIQSSEICRNFGLPVDPCVFARARKTRHNSDLTPGVLVREIGRVAASRSKVEKPAVAQRKLSGAVKTTMLATVFAE